MSVVHWHDFDRDHLRQSILRWGSGGLFICAAHAVVVYGALFTRPPPPPTPPPAAVMIELAPLPVSAPSTMEEMAPGPQMVQAPETVDAPDKPDSALSPEPMERQPVEEQAEPEPTPPEPTPPEVAEKMPELSPAPEPAEVTLPPPKPDILKKERPAPKKQVRKVKPKPKKMVHREQPKPKRTTRAKKRDRREEASRHRHAPRTSAAPRSQAAASPRSAAPTRGSSATRSVSRATWAAQISAHLNRFKRYPSGAHGASGRPSVRFSLNGSGRVTSVSLSRSSGNRALDAEALATVRRASPFPRPPDGRGASFSVPVNFTSR